MFIINESPTTLDLVERKKISPTINFITTRGFLFDYIIDDKKITLVPKDRRIVEMISSINNETVIIASDLDDAGSLISLEILALLNKKTNEIYRLKIPFEELLDMNYINEEILLKNSTKRFDIGAAKRYLKKKADPNIKTRQEVVKWLIDNYITDFDKQKRIIKNKLNSYVWS